MRAGLFHPYLRHFNTQTDKSDDNDRTCRVRFGNAGEGCRGETCDRLMGNGRGMETVPEKIRGGIGADLPGSGIQTSVRDVG